MGRPGTVTVPVVGRLWQLGAQPQSLRDSATIWRHLGTSTGDTGMQVEAAAQELLAGWGGPSAEAYRPHQQHVVRAYRAVADATTRTAAVLDSGAEVLFTTQARLDDSWHRLLGRLPARTEDGRPAYDPTDADEVGAVSAALREASAIRAEADTCLAGLANEVDRIRADLVPHTINAARAAELEAWSPPPEPASAGLVIVTGNQVIVNATGGEDTIDVHTDARTGEHVISIGGRLRRIPAGFAVVLRSGSGNDTITVQPGTRATLTLLGGAGDDVVRGGDAAETVLAGWGSDTVQGGGGADRLLGGPGPDYIDGQDGDDLLVGGGGHDTLYGLDGRDRLWAGAGRDYLDGGPGEDLLAGGANDDALFGGRDGDVLLGGHGGDALYGGDGVDLIRGGGGEDRAFSQPGDSVGAVGSNVTVPLRDAASFIEIDGAPEFQARVRSDLDALRSSPTGSEMLTALNSAHEQSRSGPGAMPVVGGLFQHTIEVKEFSQPNAYAAADVVGAGATIGYNPTFDDFELSPPVPPVVALYHELAHAYDFFYDTSAEGRHDGPGDRGAPNAERAAVGLPIDHDGDPSTPNRLDPDHPYRLTENGLRQELGLDLRTSYTRPADD